VTYIRFSHSTIESPERKSKIRNFRDERVSHFLLCESGVSMNQVVNDVPSSIVAPEHRGDFGYLSLVQLRDDYWRKMSPAPVQQ
jgi:hypothetical protein